MAKAMNLDKIITELATKYEGEIEQIEETLQPAIRVKTDKLYQVIKELKDQYGLDFLADLTGMDLGDDGLRGIYHIMSWKPYQILRIEVDISKEQPRLPSLVEIWPAADVQEREAYDMLGIIYEGHPKLTRILLSDNFEGYPLRKDFEMPSRR